MRRVGAIVERLVLPGIMIDALRIADVTGEDVGEVFDRLWAERAAPVPQQTELELVGAI